MGVRSGSYFRNSGVLDSDARGVGPIPAVGHFFHNLQLLVILALDVVVQSAT